ncbi:DUF4214 domain-containing protein [Sulfitobacter sp. F26204]|uniref:DUF4214 domain-containing protein n=1 Tax=Sulfitobacter sp. F26204 TaxID=2996014 RepID=UPI00225DFF16|nr:DUF4214 domain-containing protein [Sulfitobacter sp. F26204]MCX7561316.1 DUF4214 domain-containing protein [Sulfitobacter sp. F26204]
MAAMEAVSLAIGVVGLALSAAGLVGGNDSDEARQDTLESVKNQIGDIEKLVEAGIDAQIAESISESQTALNELTRFMETENAGLRQDIGQAAIRLANEGLNGVVGQVMAIKDAGLSIEALAHYYSSLSYAIAARQSVAITVENGPLGSRGLHEQIKTAMDVLFDANNYSNGLGPGNSIVGAMEANIFAQTTAFSDVPAGEQADEQTSVTYTLFNYTDRSPLNPIRDSVTVTREFSGSVFTGDFQVESNESFGQRLNSAFKELKRDLVETVKLDLGITALENIVKNASEFLAQTPGNIENTYEFSLSANDDVQVGTSKSDYMDGNRGDDVLNGRNGPDAIEGGLGNDILYGGEGKDFLNGGAGDDVIMGGAAFGEHDTDDTARFDGLSADYRIEGGVDYALVTNLLDGSRDKVFGVDYLRFDDGVQTLGAGSALDDAGDPADFVTAERVALLYEAALNRDGDIDTPGLNFYIQVTERDNLSDEFLAADLMTSPEFTASFGDVNMLSNSDFLEQIYLNVLDRASDAAGRQFYLDLLNDNTITKALALADIAISPENTTESVDVLMGLYENSAGEWSFI